MKYKISVQMMTEKEPGNLLDRTVKLLGVIAETGAIYPAAKRLNMTYSYAWNAIQKVEENLGEELLIRNGGSAGSNLTPKAMELIQEYLYVKSAAQSAADAAVQAVSEA